MNTYQRLQEALQPNAGQSAQPWARWYGNYWGNDTLSDDPDFALGQRIRRNYNPPRTEEQELVNVGKTPPIYNPGQKSGGGLFQQLQDLISQI